jgi:DsbC/DsbD-like thiol-disulfide interchange protein
MNLELLRQACINIGLIEPISIEQDGTVWTGVDPDRVYPDMAPILAEYESLMADEPRKQVESQRKAAYTTESDPVFFQWQRGDATEQEWLDAVEAVKAKYPYPA